jgi:hypothetical protein
MAEKVVGPALQRLYSLLAFAREAVVLFHHS